MIFDSPFWPRPRYLAGGGDALVAFEVSGDFPAGFSSDFARDNLKISVQANDLTRFSEVALEMLRASNPAAAPILETAPQMVSLRGTFPDPSDLEYLRQSLGLIFDLLQSGGAGVIDPQTLQIFAPAEWENLFWSGAFEPTSHATILLSPQGEKLWLHTRGMRVFGRPDLSCHGVLPAEVERLQPVFNGLIRMQAAGALLPDGQIVQAIGIENRLICRARGSLDDADFDNFHLELEWDGPRGEAKP